MVSKISIENREQCLKRNQCMTQGCQETPPRNPVNCTLWLAGKRAEIEQLNSATESGNSGDGVVGEFTKDASKGIR